MWKLETPDKAVLFQKKLYDESTITIGGTDGNYFFMQRDIFYIPTVRTEILSSAMFKTKEEAQKALADFVADRNEKIKHLENLKKIYEENLRGVD